MNFHSSVRIDETFGFLGGFPVSKGLPDCKNASCFKNSIIVYEITNL